MRVSHFLTIAEPSIVVSFQIASPVLVLNMVEGMRSHHQTVILPIFHDAVRSRNRYVTIGNNVIIVRQLHRQKIQQALFSGIYRSIVMRRSFNDCHNILFLIVVKYIFQSVNDTFGSQRNFFLQEIKKLPVLQSSK